MNSYFDGQRVGFGNDEHDLLTGGNNASDSVNGQLVDDAILRRPDINPLELVQGCNLFFHEFRCARTDIGEFAAHFRAHILLDLHDLQL